ncbi:MAG: hypothetical protein Q9219_005718 [cf. Caloplaca sp. 3 TL-2023]
MSGVLPAAIRTRSGNPSASLPASLSARSARVSIAKRNVLDDYRELYTGMNRLLPLQGAAAFLDDTLSDISVKALSYWLHQSPDLPCLTLAENSLSLTFFSSKSDVPVPWEFVVLFCEHLAIEVIRGWTGVYEGSWTHTSTQVVIYVRMGISMVAAAA